MHSLTRKLAFDLAPRAPLGGAEAAQEGTGGPITVNALAPGYVPTRMTAGLGAWGADESTISQAVPLRRMGRAEDMAGAALFLASPAASWVTGVVLPVDGGCLAQPIQLGFED